MILNNRELSIPTGLFLLAGGPAGGSYFYPGSFWQGVLCCQSWNPIRCYLSVVDDKLDRFRSPRGACELKQKSTLHNKHVPSLTTGVSHRMESLSTCQYLLRQLPPSMMTLASSHQDFFLFFCFF